MRPGSGIRLLGASIGLIATALVTGVLAAGPASAGALRPVPDGQALDFRSGTATVDRRSGTATITLRMQPMGLAWSDASHLAFVFENAHGARGCSPKYYDLTLYASTAFPLGDSRVLPAGSGTLQGKRIGTWTYRYKIASPLLKKSTLNCVWVAAVPDGDTDWFINGGAVSGLLTP